MGIEQKLDNFIQKNKLLFFILLFATLLALVFFLFTDAQVWLLESYEFMNFRTNIIQILSLISLFLLVPLLYQRITHAPKWDYIVLILLIVLLILPIISFKYFPSHDGPPHLHGVKVLHDYSENSLFQEYYNLNLNIFPNWFFQAFAYLLGGLFSIYVVEKIFLLFYIGVFLFSFNYSIKHTNKKSSYLFLFGFLLSYNYFLMMGFYNFAISLAFFFLQMRRYGC